MSKIFSFFLIVYVCVCGGITMELSVLGGYLDWVNRLQMYKTETDSVYPPLLTQELIEENSLRKICIYPSS